MPSFLPAFQPGAKKKQEHGDAQEQVRAHIDRHYFN
jgi:hypothetical protein